MNAANLLLCVAVAITSADAGPDVETPGTHAEVAFSDYPSTATAAELAKRVLSPLAAASVWERNGASGEALRPTMFDIAGERFVLFVPKRRPARGYGLLVFVPPWPQGEIPDGWVDVLERNGTIFVSAERSGNDQNLLERRIPLALAALANVRERFPIDPQRTFVGGFSGGSRVALRIALDYPDLFSGALLNAGSDPIGEAPLHLPGPSLLLKFQTRTRLAFVTGQRDLGSLALDSTSIRSLRHWCVENIAVRDEAGAGHDPATAVSLDWALRTLSFEPRRDSGQFEACRAARLEEVHDRIDKAEAALAAGEKDEARRLILDIDRKYGGLAAAQMLSLAGRCSCALP